MRKYFIILITDERVWALIYSWILTWLIFEGLDDNNNNDNNSIDTCKRDVIESRNRFWEYIGAVYRV